MNQATNINVVPGYGQRGDLHFSQYDVGRTATINLYAVNEAYTIPLGATVKIQATKPSGLGFDVACTYSGSVVTVVSTSTMTEEAGRFPAELHIIDNSDVIGTANFMFCVEASPHPDGTIDGDAEEVVNEIKALVLESEGYALGTQDGIPVDNTSPYYHNNAKWWSEHPVGGGISDDIKQALLNCFQNVAWIGDDGQDYYDALQSALYPPAELVSISAVYTQSGTVYDTDSLDSLKDDLVVTATYDDSSTETVTTYTLSGTLTAGTSTITVSYGGKTDTFTVTVTAEPVVPPIYNWDLKTSLTDTVGSVTATTTADFTLGTGLVFSANNTYIDFGQVYARGRTYEIDILSIGDALQTTNHYRRLICFDTDANTSQGGACLLCSYASSRYGWIFYKGSNWDLQFIYGSTSGSEGDHHAMFDGKTLKLYLDSSGYAHVYSKTIGASDSTYTLIGSSGGALNNYTNGHVYFGGSTSDYLANATITGFRIYEGEK